MTKQNISSQIICRIKFIYIFQLHNILRISLELTLLLQLQPHRLRAVHVGDAAMYMNSYFFVVLPLALLPQFDHAG